MAVTGNRNDSPVRDLLLVELTRRQPLLATINIGTALLFVSGLANAARPPVLLAWLAYMGVSQAARLIHWRPLIRKPHATSRGLIAASAMAGLGWGITGILFAGLGSPTQQMLVPFFLAGMAAGSVVSLAAHPPAFYAFIVPALLPYAAHLALSDGQAARTMALTILAYGMGLSAVAYQVHQSLWRQVKLQIENGRLVADLGRTRGRLQELFERRSAELEAVMETVPVAVWLAHDREAERITGNRQAAEITRLGHRNSASLGEAAQRRPDHFRLLRDNAEVSRKDLPLQRAARGEAVHGEELRVAFGDGAVRDILISAAPVRDGLGATTGAVAVAMDITERKRIEQELRASETRLRLAVDAGRMAVWTFDAVTQSVKGSAELGRVLGLPAGHEPTYAEICARFAGGGEKLQEAVRAAVERGDKFVELEGRYVRPDGSERWIQLRCELMLAEGSVSGATGVLMDITSRKESEAARERLNQELEARVREEVAAREAAQVRAAQAERMQALGQLAGGIAHDFNNVLQAVTGGVAMIEHQTDRPETVRRFSRLIADAALRGTSVTRRLLAFARRGDLRAASIGAGEVLEGLREILVHTLGSGIEARIDVPADLPPMLIDRGQLETVLVNLAVNAYDAMPAGGTLTLSARHDTVGDVHHAELRPGQYIAIAVSDTGGGMTTETLRRASEPFFTTKSHGKGTGLGLAMAKGFAEQSGGGLFIESRVGAGTTVTLWLPEAPASASAPSRATCQTLAQSGR